MDKEGIIQQIKDIPGVSNAYSLYGNEGIVVELEKEEDGVGNITPFGTPHEAEHYATLKIGKEIVKKTKYIYKSGSKYIVLDHHCGDVKPVKVISPDPSE